MKSPTTLIKLHERAIRYQEMIKDAEYYTASQMVNARSFRKIPYLPFSTVSDCVKRARRYNRIRNYLITRYESLITKLN